MFKNIELYLLEVIKGKRKGFLALIFKSFLRLLSYPFQLAATFRNWAFDKGLLRRYYPPVPLVISIGNIVAGGTGKTPATLMIAQEFYSDFLIAILARGYRSYAETLSSPVVLSKGDGPMHPASYCGDEPYLLSQNLPKAIVIVGKNRYKSSNLAAKAGAHLILLDDGMQHRHLARDLEVVIMDAQDPFGQGHFLPRGLLRESAKSLSRGNLIILNHIDHREQFLQLKQQVARHSSAFVVGTRMVVEKIWDFQGVQIPDIKNKKVAIFCSIANPDYFRRTVTNLEAEIVDHYFIADHKTFDQQELKNFAKRSIQNGAEMLLCTEKDRVKLGLSPTNIPLGWIQMRLQIVEEEANWKEFIQKAKTDLLRRI
jgi:tetraacyldisaccharide 4'-kinase